MLQRLDRQEGPQRRTRHLRLVRIALTTAERRDLDDLAAGCRFTLEIEDHLAVAAGASRAAGLRSEGQIVLLLASARLGVPALLELLGSLGASARDRPPLILLADVGDGLVVEAMREACRADWLFVYDLTRDSLARALELAYERASRLQMEDDLSLSLDLAWRELAAVLARIDEGVLFVDPRLRIERASRRAASLLGRGQREIVGLPFTALGWVEPVQARRDLAGGEPLAGAHLELEDGEGRRRRLQVRVYRLAGSAAAGLSGIRRMVVLSDADGGPPRLPRGDTLTARLTLAVAHDLGNVLTPVLGHADRLRSRLEGDASLGKAAAEIVRSSELAIDLVRSLHAAHGSLGEPPVRHGADALVARLAPLLQALVGKRVQLALALEAPEAQIVVRPSDLARVLLNLVANARDAIPGDGSIAILSSRGERAEWVLEVVDSGTGIAAGDRERIFEPGYSGKGSSGLGLAIVRSLLEEAGAEITVDSTPGRGCRMRVAWPTVAEEVGEAPASG
ncbi:MAG: hypothetical protein KDB94_01575 [Acidobacteria bacterium]|nr:hypothetical protein [Acidobacteriota bacterium]MCB9377666.1 hypothetical protein [Holophagales bacterium]